MRIRYQLQRSPTRPSRLIDVERGMAVRDDRLPSEVWGHKHRPRGLVEYLKSLNVPSLAARREWSPTGHLVDDRHGSVQGDETTSFSYALPHLFFYIFQQKLHNTHPQYDESP